MRCSPFFTVLLVISPVAGGCDVESEPEEQRDMSLIGQDDDEWHADEEEDAEIDESDEEIDVRNFSEEEIEELINETPWAAVNCTYIQWCNVAGPYGTVCRVREGCVKNQDALNECAADANAVCGGLTNPWLYKYWYESL